MRPSRLNMMAFCPKYRKWDQNLKFTPLSDTTSIPTPFICVDCFWPAFSFLPLITNVGIDLLSIVAYYSFYLWPNTSLRIIFQVRVRTAKKKSSTKSLQISFQKIIDYIIIILLFLAILNVDTFCQGSLCLPDLSPLLAEVSHDEANHFCLVVERPLLACQDKTVLLL